MTILNLVLTHKWYDMIDSGVKTEEYREIRPFWHNRIVGKEYTHVCFHRGYTKTTMLFEMGGITMGKGKSEWGAPDKPVFIIKLGKRVEK